MNAPNWFAAMLAEAAAARDVNGRGGVARVAQLVGEPRPNIDRCIENLPDGTPCIFSVRPEGQTLKLLRRANDGTRDGAIYGEPVNRAHMTVIFRKSPALRIPFVVVTRYDVAESEIKQSKKRRIEYGAPQEA